MLKRNFAVVLIAGLVLGGGAVALAGGDPPRPTVLAAQTDPPPSSPPDAEAAAERRAAREALRACLEQAGEDEAARRACKEAAGPAFRHGREHRRGPGPLGLVPLGRAVHGTVTVPDGNGGWHEVTFDKGTVDEATDASKIVLDRADGQTVTIELTAETKYHGVADAAALVDGRPALVVSRDGKALHVAQRDPDRRHRPGNNGEAPGVQRD
jgi:hypothetical protein